MIRLESLTKTYDTLRGPLTALDDINLEVTAGSIDGVIGKSGAGKSTLIRCVNRLETPTSGKVIIDGVDITTLSDAALRETRHSIGMIFQHFNLLASSTVHENIAFPLKLAKKSRKEIDKIVAPLLELTGLTDKHDIYPAKLSGGQKQRVAIARALANQPKILLCDEATSALDPNTTLSILELLKNINSELGLTILLITHEMDVIKRICDNVAIIEAGKIIEHGKVRDLFAHAQTPIAQQFIQSSLHVNLPTAITNSMIAEPKVAYSPVVQISFHGDAIYQPLISHLITTWTLQVNILQANIEPLKNEMMGMLVIQLQGSNENLQHGLDFLQQQKLKVEVLGYVPSHDMAIA